MQIAFTATKLNPPPVPRELVLRPRLIDRLNRGLEGKLILVSTPAGYGKTTLLSAWAAQCPLPVAWISLDEGDNDPVRFLQILAAAFNPIFPGIDQSLSNSLQSPQAPALEELLASLLNEIAQISRAFVLVLDDYHLITEPAIHRAMITLLGHLPAQMHLAIASRADPPLQLARLRARSELTELRLADLCFTLGEASQFLLRSMELRLPADQVAALTARAEGWIAGLQMAAISLRSATDPAGFIQSFSGSHRFILDYLVEEVLQDQPEEVQTFLLKTSVLNRLAGPLCDVVAGLQDSQEILERLERHNLFIIPLDEERVWYRYHQLFLDLLRKRALQRFPGEQAGWQRAASRWFESQGYLEEATEYALAAGDFTRAAGLVETAAQSTLLRSEIYTFRGWVKCLPEAELDARPDLILFYAWVLVLTDSPPDSVEPWLNKVNLRTERIAAKVSVIRGYQAFMQGDIMRAMILLQQAQAGLSPEETLFRSVVAWMLSLVYVQSGDFHTGGQALEEVFQTSLQKKQLIIAVGARCALAELALRQGQLQAACEHYEAALSIAHDSQGRLPVAARPLMGLSDVRREWNDLDQAIHDCSEGISLAGQLRESTAIVGHITLARIRQALGEEGQAQEALQKAWELACQTEATVLDDLYVRLSLARLAIQQGDLAEVERWMDERGLPAGFSPDDLDQKDDYYRYHVLKYELLVAARGLIASGQPQQALGLLAPLLFRMEAQGRVHLVIEALLLEALAHQALGDRVRALACFERSLALAEPGGYTRLFLDEGTAILPLLQAAARGETTPEYASRLLAALEAESAPAGQAVLTRSTLPSQTTGLIEPLTERELELLALIAAGLSNQEIARRLFISLPTVKWHTSNIYGKLGVRNRMQAVAHARELGILPTDVV